MTTKQEYIDVLGQAEELYYNYDNCTLAMNLFKEDINLLIEYDLLSVHNDYETYNNIANQIHLFKMREKGYFRDVDTKIPICEILDNCEVV